MSQPEKRGPIKSSSNKTKIHSCWIKKKAGVMTTWKRRFLIYYADKSFEYYTSDDLKEFKGEGNFGNIQQIQEDGLQVTITTPERTWHFQFDDMPQRDTFKDIVEPSKHLKEANRLKEQVNALEEHKKQNHEENMKLQSALIEMREHHEKVQSQLELDHVRNYVQESEMEELKNELALLKKEKQVLDNKHLGLQEFLQTRCAELESKLVYVEEQKATLSFKVEESKRINEIKTEQIRNLEEEHRILETQYIEERNLRGKLLASTGEKEQAVLSLNETLGETQQQFLLLKETLRTKQQEYLSLKKALGEKEHESLSLKEALNEKEEEKSSIEKTLHEKEELYSLLQNTVNEQEQTHSSLKDMIEIKEEKVGRLTNQVGDLQKALALDKDVILDLENTITRLNAVNFTMEKKCQLSAQKMKLIESEHNIKVEDLRSEVESGQHTIADLKTALEENETHALPEKSADQSTWANWFLNNCVDVDEDVKNFVHNSEDAQKIVYLLGTKVQSTSKEQNDKETAAYKNRTESFIGGLQDVMKDLGLGGGSTPAGELVTEGSVKGMERRLHLLKAQVSQYKGRATDLEGEVKRLKNKVKYLQKHKGEN